MSEHLFAGDFARTGTTDPTGKLDRHVPVVLSEQMENDIIGCAFARGMNKSEYIREVLRAHLYGQKAVVQSKVSGIPIDGDGRNVP